jgi:hypothetical protein
MALECAIVTGRDRRSCKVFTQTQEPPPLELELGPDLEHNIIPWHWDKHTGKDYDQTPA